MDKNILNTEKKFVDIWEENFGLNKLEFDEANCSFTSLRHLQKAGRMNMIPNNRAFKGRVSFEEDGKTFYRSYKIEKQGKFRLIIRVVSINSHYRQAIAFSLSSSPKFKGLVLINGQKFKAEKKKLNYVIPVELPDKNEIIMDFDIVEGYIHLANASDFLDDYPEMIEKISAQTGRTRDQFRGCSFTSGLSAGFLYGNAFWLESLSENSYRFHCNDHKLDDDFDDLVFDLEIESASSDGGLYE